MTTFRCSKAGDGWATVAPEEIGLARERGPGADTTRGTTEDHR